MNMRFCSGEVNTSAAAIRECSEFCRSDVRCIGMELCNLGDELYRCRACCDTMKIEEDTGIYKDSDTCRYLEMGEPVFVVAFNKPASISSIFQPAYQHASNAVDNVTTCPTGLSNAHTQSEFRLWIKIDLQSVYNINRVIIHNRQDQSGNRLRNLQINVGLNGTESVCGFFKGPGRVKDRIVVLCTSGARGDYVITTIMSQPRTTNILSVCEI